MEFISVDEELLFDFLGGLPWPAIVISDEGRVLRVTGNLPGIEPLPTMSERPAFATIFPDYFSVLRGDTRWRVPQEAKSTRQTPQGVIHERLLLRRTATESWAGSYLLVIDETKSRTQEVTNAQTARLAALGFMVAGVCHEVSNPLASIHSMIQILRADKNIAPELLDRGLDTIAVSVKRLLAISRRLVDFGRADDEPRATFPVDLAIEEALAVIRHDPRSERVTFTFERDPQALIFGSSNQMQEVFVNLFANGLQAMAGTGKLGIKTQRSGTGRVVVSVTDTGPGIPSEVMPRLFEPFFTTRPRGCGTGLGLSITYEIVREHAGVITAANNSDIGACFRIELPLQGGMP